MHVQLLFFQRQKRILRWRNWWMSLLPSILLVKRERGTNIMPIGTGVVVFTGQETTSNLLSFALLLLLIHPHVLQRYICCDLGILLYVILVWCTSCRVLEEIKEVVGDKPSVEADDLDKLIYIKQVFKIYNINSQFHYHKLVEQNVHWQVFEESLRLVPPVPIVSKEAPQGGLTLSGYIIPQGTTLWVRVHRLVGLYNWTIIYYAAALFDGYGSLSMLMWAL